MSGPTQDIALAPVGIIRTPFTEAAGMPIQATGARDVEGTIEIDPALAAGLADLDGFSHLILIYHLHRAREATLTVVPFLDTVPRGVFATRAPRRPNPIGLTVVRLIGVDGNILKIKDIDVIDGTPLLDLKPYVPAFDSVPDARAGWLEGKGGIAGKTRSDGRFA